MGVEGGGGVLHIAGSGGHRALRTAGRLQRLLEFLPRGSQLALRLAALFPLDAGPKAARQPNRQRNRAGVHALGNRETHGHTALPGQPAAM